MYHGPSIDHSLISPSGRMSKRARAAALERERVRLFGEAGLQRGTPQQPSELQKLEWRIRDVRGWLEAGMRPRAFRKELAELEAKAAQLR